MLVKIKGEGSNWTIFDNAEQVEYNSSPERISSPQDLYLLGNSAEECTYILPTIVNDGIDFQIDKPTDVGFIKFTRQQKTYIVIFNTIAYLCNDSGKTVEKIGGFLDKEKSFYDREKS